MGMLRMHQIFSRHRNIHKTCDDDHPLTQQVNNSSVKKHVKTFCFFPSFGTFNRHQMCSELGSDDGRNAIESRDENLNQDFVYLFKLVSNEMKLFNPFVT